LSRNVRRSGNGPGEGRDGRKELANQNTSAHNQGTKQAPKKVLSPAPSRLRNPAKNTRKRPIEVLL